MAHTPSALLRPQYDKGPFRKRHQQHRLTERCWPNLCVEINFRGYANSRPRVNDAPLAKTDQITDCTAFDRSQPQYHTASTMTTPASISHTPVGYSSGDSTDAMCHATGWVMQDAVATTTNTRSGARIRASQSMTGISQAIVNNNAWSWLISVYCRIFCTQFAGV